MYTFIAHKTKTEIIQFNVDFCLNRKTIKGMHKFIAILRKI